MSTPSAHVVPLGPDHLDAAAHLLAARHARWRAVEPMLHERYAQVAEARRLLDSAMGADGARGVAAVSRAGDLLGYMLGAPRLEEIWGRSAWVPLEGLALAEGVDAELVRDLYAAWADGWVERGVFAHYALVPAAFAETVEAWFNLGFGKMQAYALRSVETESLGPAPEGVLIRRATPADIDLVMQLGDLISRALLEAPTFAITLPERWAEYRAGYLEDLELPEDHLWLALDEATGAAIGLAGFFAEEPGPAVPEHAVELGVAMTAPEARGRGVMRGLLAHGLAVAAASGATSSVTDWRVANLTASRTWPSLGYRPLYWRLHRMVDHRILWARRAAPQR